QWAFDDQRLAKKRRAPVHVLDHARRLAAFVSLLSLRIAATATALDPHASSEEAAEAAHRALGLPCSPAVATLMLDPRGGASARLRGELHGLAFFSALRDRYDVDWYRNPRARDVVRGACERGAALSVEALGAELGVGPEAGIERLAAWFRGGR
ncbi:MAG: hypothetical protein H5U40_01385, partial [Polyangiaceae bacterium]|nr:hypothetical protein [Polyangiaceae bacterium]